MSVEQSEALAAFRNLVENEHLLQKLDVEDCRDTMTKTNMIEVSKLLNDIFFLGAISPIQSRWVVLRFEDRSAFTAPYFDPETKQHSTAITMTPMRLDSDYEIRPAAQRLGVLLHEMTIPCRLSTGALGVERRA